MINVIVKNPGELPFVEKFSDLHKKNIAELIGCSITDKVILEKDRLNALYCYVDDLAITKKLPFNFKLETNSKQYPIQNICGTVVIVRIVIFEDDFEYVTTTQKDLALLEQLLKRSEEL